MKNLTVQESYDQRQANRSIPFIDVRTPAEYGSAHAENALNHPMESLDVNNQRRRNPCDLPFGGALNESMPET